MQVRKKLIITAAITAAIASGTVAIQQTKSGANEVPPIYEQVEQHEGRITNLEGRQDTTEAKVEQNSSDIQVIQQETGVAPASGSYSPTTSTSTQTSSGTAQSVPVSQPAPEPAPEPAPHPRTITAVVDAPSNNGLHSCDYTLYDRIEDSRQGTVMQPAEIPCHAVGEVLPQL